MEIILAIVVASAVIFFGALISMGNERQRKAIDNLREQVVNWAIQDLKLKRENLARTIQVADPLVWFSNIASKACGHNMQLQMIEVFETPQSLVCATGDGNSKVIFSSLSPSELHQIRNSKRSRLSQYVEQNPLFLLSGNFGLHEISVLNGGPLFDLELSLAWKQLTGRDTDPLDRIWLYEVP